MGYGSGTRCRQGSSLNLEHLEIVSSPSWHGIKAMRTDTNPSKQAAQAMCQGLYIGTPSIVETIRLSPINSGQSFSLVRYSLVAVFVPQYLVTDIRTSGGQGLVSISHSWADAHNLPTTMSDRHNRSYGVYFVAVYHQLHCLVRLVLISCLSIFDWPYQSVVRAALYHYQEGVAQTVDWLHMVHCLDSLRQSLMCSADDTLLYSNGSQVFGDGQLHVCRNWNTLRSWTEGHKYSWKVQKYRKEEGFCIAEKMERHYVSLCTRKNINQ